MFDREKDGIMNFMKTKLPFTEKFLWDLYNFKKEIVDPVKNIVFGKRALPFSDFNIFKDEWTGENKKKYLKEKNKRNFSKIVQHLKERGYLKVLRIKGKNAAVITTKGFDKLFKIKLKLVKNNKRKDGKWQMVLFDIPESKRGARDYFRRGLRYLGYKRLQKSIWVCEYDVLRETKELIKRYKLNPFVELLLVEKIGLG